MPSPSPKKNVVFHILQQHFLIAFLTYKLNAMKKNSSPRTAFLLHDLSPYRIPLYEQLTERLDDFQIFCLKAPSPLPDCLKNRVSIFSTGKLHHTILKKIGIPLPSLKLIKALKRWDPHVVVMEGMSNIGNDLFTLPFISKNKIPFIWWSLGYIPSQSHTLRARLGVPLQKWFLRHASASLAYSSFAKKYMISLGADPKTLFVVHNTLDEKKLIIDAEKNKPRSVQLRKKLQLEDRPTAVFIGQINKGKRIDLLIEAFSEVQKKLKEKNPALLIIGDGPSLKEHQDQAKELGLEQDVLFVGQQTDEASAYLLLGDICVLPGLGGLAINHAFSHKIPIICGRADGCEEDLVFTDETGIRLSEVTLESLTSALIDTLSHLEKCKKMGENGFKLITEKITMEHFTKQVEQAIRTAYSNH